MREMYKSKYYADLHSFLGDGWTEDEIQMYFPIIESLSSDQLLELHEMCHIKMFKQGEGVNAEMAIHPLVNVRDTPKELLLSAVFIQQCERLIVEKEKGSKSVEEVGSKILQMSFETTFPEDSIFEHITDLATELEMPREMSIGAGINIGDRWTQEIADGYKEKLWKEFKNLSEQAKKTFYE